MKRRKSLSLLFAALLWWSCVPQKTVTSPDAKKQVDQHYQMGITYLAEGKTPQAIKELLSAQLLAPDNADVEHALGLAYQQKGLYDQAIFQYQKAITLDPKLTEARNNMATSYLAKGNYPQAIAELETCLKDSQYGTPEKAFYNLGFANLKQKNFDKAIEYYDKVVQFNSDNVNALYYLGLAHMEKQDYARALENLKRVATLEPAFQDVQYRLGLVYEQQKDFSKAIAYFKKAIEADSANLQARLHLGMALLRMGENAAGLKHLETVAKVDPDGDLGKKAAGEISKAGTDNKFQGIPKVNAQ